MMDMTVFVALFNELDDEETKILGVFTSVEMAMERCNNHSSEHHFEPRNEWRPYELSVPMLVITRRYMQGNLFYEVQQWHVEGTEGAS